MRELNLRNKSRVIGCGSTRVGENHGNERRLLAPEVFSLTENPTDSLRFFEKVFKVVSEIRTNQRVFIDLSEVKRVSADSIMYLIALIRNTKRLNILDIIVSGNMPVDDSTRKYIEDIGFYKFVSSLKPGKANVKAVDKFSISHGANVDASLVGSICEFARMKQSGCYTETKQLYRMILELMTNTAQHAYLGSTMTNHWYVFSERQEGVVRFVFLDTGVGIPKTIKTKPIEKVTNFIAKEKYDASYISSALRGEFRTETGKDYRGKGLPGVYEDSIDGTISDMTIISGNGKCGILKDGIMEETVLKRGLEGTLFCWNTLQEGNETLYDEN